MILKKNNSGGYGAVNQLYNANNLEEVIILASTS